MKPLGTYGQYHLISVLFAVSASLAFVGVLMFTYRVFLHGRIFSGFVRWERGLIALGAIICALGFIVLAVALRASGKLMFSWVGLAVVALGTALIVITELRVVFGLASTLDPSVRLPELGGVNPLILLGVALTPEWTGWLMVIWNLGWLMVVFLLSARDPYYPVLFYTGPLVLSVLLWR